MYLLNLCMLGHCKLLRYFLLKSVYCEQQYNFMNKSCIHTLTEKYAIYTINMLDLKKIYLLNNSQIHPFIVEYNHLNKHNNMFNIQLKMPIFNEQICQENE